MLPILENHAGFDAMDGLNKALKMNLAEAWEWFTHVPYLGFLAFILGAVVCLFVVTGLWGVAMEAGRRPRV